MKFEVIGSFSTFRQHPRGLRCTWLSISVVVSASRLSCVAITGTVSAVALVARRCPRLERKLRRTNQLSHRLTETTGAPNGPRTVWLRGFQRRLCSAGFASGICMLMLGQSTAAERIVRGQTGRKVEAAADRPVCLGALINCWIRALFVSPQS